MGLLSFLIGMPCGGYLVALYYVGSREKQRMEKLHPYWYDNDA
jgi:hypothetical protein